MKKCKCGHTIAKHPEPHKGSIWMYDFLPRPCRVIGCDCEHFAEKEAICEEKKDE